MIIQPAQIKTMSLNDSPMQGRVLHISWKSGANESFFALCWEQPENSYTACDRMKHHKGKHSWEE